MGLWPCHVCVDTVLAVLGIRSFDGHCWGEAVCILDTKVVVIVGAEGRCDAGYVKVDAVVIDTAVDYDMSVADSCTVSVFGFVAMPGVSCVIGNSCS